MARTLDHGPDLCSPRGDRALLLEHGIGVLGDDPGQRGLAAAWRSVEDHRVRSPRLDCRPQRRPGMQQMILAHELLERPRTQARG